jgi:hypothetical protein
MLLLSKEALSMKVRVYPSTVRGVSQSLIAPATTLLEDLPDVPSEFENPELFIGIELTPQSRFKHLNSTKALADIEVQGYHIAPVYIETIAEWDDGAK